MTNSDVNFDAAADFGDEWRRFAQSAMPEPERRRVFESQFASVPGTSWLIAKALTWVAAAVDECSWLRPVIGASSLTLCPVVRR